MKLKFIYSSVMALLAICLLFSIVVYAQTFILPPETINQARPTIRVQFNEMIKLERAELSYVLPSFPFPIMVPMITNTSDNMTFLFIPLQPLLNFDHVLKLDVTDLVGNELSYEKTFYVQVDVTNITIISPRMGVSDKVPFNITIQTKLKGINEKTDCRYSAADPFYNLTRPTLKNFNYSNTFGDEHTIVNYPQPPEKQPTMDSPNTLFIICNNTAGRLTQMRFAIYADKTAPSFVSFIYDPSPVVEYSQTGQLVSTLKLETNEETICKYSQTSQDYASMTTFINYSNTDYGAYKKKNEQFLILPPLAGEMKAEHTFYFGCEDRAGYKTGVKSQKLGIDLSAPLTITVNSPKPFTNEGLVTLNITTNKRGYCQFIPPNSTEFMQMSSSAVYTSNSHTANIGTLEVGSYTVDIKCFSASAGFQQEAAMKYTFSIDKTAPGTTTYNGSTTTCFADKFQFIPALTFTSLDNESGIDHYEYQLKSSSEVLINSSSTASSISDISKDDKGNVFNLTTGVSYSLLVKAVNKVGLAGTAATISVKYNPSAVECLEKNPPTVSIKEEKSTNGIIVTLECTDISGCDPNKYYYGLANTAAACIAASPLYGPPFVQTLYTTQYFCWNVSDIYGNSVAGSKEIKADIALPNECQDGVLGSGEVDIDCGGQCVPCDIGKNCTLNTDCLSSYCAAGKCTEAACNDTVKNQDETDIDCGGSCDACELGKDCKSDRDCTSYYCSSDNSTCDLSSCTDKVKNGNETDIDCGGGSCTKCSATGAFCKVNEDCQSGMCEFNKCGAVKLDSDNDGIPDDDELKYGLNPNDPKDANGDLDKDGLTNVDEYKKYKTRIDLADTDGDGFSDFEEVEAGTNPLDPDDHPASVLKAALNFALFFLPLILGMLAIIGGSSYLGYKKYYVSTQQKPKPVLQKPTGVPGTPLPPVARPVSRDEIEARKRAMEERQRRMEQLKQRVQKVEEKKEQEREKLFQAFGPPVEKKDEPKKIKPGKEYAPEIRPAAYKDDWMSLDSLKESFKPKEKKPEPVKTVERPQPKPVAREFEQIDKLIMPKKEDMKPQPKEAKEEGIFDKLKSFVKKEESTDIYQELKKTGGKSGEDALSDLEKEAGKAPKGDIFQELEKKTGKTEKKDDPMDELSNLTKDKKGGKKK